MKSPQQKCVRYRSGDVFAIPLPDMSFGYGQILLDIFRIRRRHVLRDHCSLNGLYGSGLLIHLYDHRDTARLTNVSVLQTAKTFPQQLAAHDQILSGEFEIVGNLPVGPHNIDFPEYVTNNRPAPGEWHFYFQKGCIVAKLATGFRALLRGVMRDINPTHLLALINSTMSTEHYFREDLRQSPERNRILRLAGLSGKMTYDEMADRKGSLPAKELIAMGRLIATAD